MGPNFSYGLRLAFGLRCSTHPMACSSFLQFGTCDLERCWTYGRVASTSFLSSRATAVHSKLIPILQLPRKTVGPRPPGQRTLLRHVDGAANRSF
jgi:hypothetical protein